MSVEDRAKELNNLAQRIKGSFTNFNSQFKKLSQKTTRIQRNVAERKERSAKLKSTSSSFGRSVDNVKSKVLSGPSDILGKVLGFASLLLFGVTLANIFKVDKKLDNETEKMKETSDNTGNFITGMTEGVKGFMGGFGKLYQKTDKTFDDLDNSLNSFRGTLQQIPPKVSSVHINGERAYKKSWRKENFTLPSKEVRVESLILKDWDLSNKQLRIEINCSSGTYIRSIARDLGNLLKSGGCLYDLRRIKASGFSEVKSIDLEHLINKRNHIDKLIIPISEALDHMPKIYLSNELDILFWRTGRKIEIKSKNLIKKYSHFEKQNFLVFDNEYQLLGIGNYVHKDFDLLLPKLVINAL